MLTVEAELGGAGCSVAASDLVEDAALQCVDCLESKADAAAASPIKTPTSPPLQNTSSQSNAFRKRPTEICAQPWPPPVLPDASSTRANSLAAQPLLLRK